MTNRQKEELAKLYLDLGKLIFASLVLGFFQSSLPPILIFSYSLLGLTLSAGFLIMGLRLFREI